MTLKERLLELIELEGMNPNQFYNATGLGNGFLDKVGAALKKPSVEKISKAFPKWNIDYLQNGNSPKFKEIIYTPDSLSNENYKLIPICSLDVVGGAQNDQCDVFGFVTGYIPFVNASDSDISVPVTGNSMFPTYPSGSIIQIGKVELWDAYLEFGQVYVIVLKDGRRLLKEIKRGINIDSFLLHSHNAEFEDSDLPKYLIASIWIVKAKYEKSTM